MSSGVSGDRAANSGAVAKAAAQPIVLYCDLSVDPAREQELLDHFHNRFRPVAATHRGFIDLKLVRFRTLLQGGGLADAVNYRFQLTYESEELRQAWVASDDHAEYWPGIEACLTDKYFHASIFDIT